MEGHADIEFDVIRDLGDTFGVKNIGYLMDNKPTTLINAISEINVTRLKLEDVILKDITDKSVIIIAKPNTLYKGQAIFNFGVKRNLQDIIQITNLGPVMPVNMTNVVKAVNKVNKINLDMSDLQFDRTSDVKRGKITASHYSPYYNVVYVKYNS